ncbi:MAG: isopentenyl-diphosphate Delta-isomerase [Bacteroidetes bacterium]|nr:isopentenyl-diphosphate Delta-isomerase [Bacteroidota bacterium]
MVNDIILVNEQDEQIDTMDKMQAHRKALLHRAFSVFIFNSKGEMLLQKRAAGKYHSPGLWTNACCSHPRPGESTESAAIRRLQEELGFAVPLRKLFDFVYKTDFDNGLSEHEFDHVFAGTYDGALSPDAGEVQDYCFKSRRAIRDSLAVRPDLYTVWFRIAFPMLEKWMTEQEEDFTTTV